MRGNHTGNYPLIIGDSDAGVRVYFSDSDKRIYFIKRKLNNLRTPFNPPFVVAARLPGIVGDCAEGTLRAAAVRLFFSSFK